MQEDFYNNYLYPLQNEVLKKLSAIGSDFYLTGGTVLGRFLLNHRFSDDLDFFLNDSKEFKTETAKCISAFESSEIILEKDLFTSHFARIFVIKNKTRLKIEFINNVPFHSGFYSRNEFYPKIDNWGNILSNKISALE